ncbi:TetR family transcriptional regulator [Streptomyces sp. NPDC093546]|uniref:TetR/AcrR family transcriptional regulator n=1 Tax=Streptomyces sp. NPDC093546 TaxID=3366040 RepID=UPI0038153ECE
MAGAKVVAKAEAEAVPGAGGAEAERPRAGTATRDRLLMAASALFAERGYERATVREIAARAGVNQALLFRHFGSKQALFGEVVARGGHAQLRSTPPEQLVEVVVRSLLRPTAEGKPAEAEHAGVDRSLETLLRSVGGDDEVAAVVTALGDEYARALATLSTADDRGLRADLALSWLLGIGLMRVVVGRQPLADADADDVCRLVGSALRHLLEGLPSPAERHGAAEPCTDEAAR